MMHRATTTRRWSVRSLRDAEAGLAWARVAWRASVVLAGLAAPIGIVEWQAAMLGAIGMSPGIVDIARLIRAGADVRRTATIQGDKQ